MTAGGPAPAESGPRPRGPFPRDQRVRRRQEFLRIQAEGRRLTTAHLLVMLHAAPEHLGRTKPRLGVTVTRRQGTSVVRNRLKRLVREAFRATRELWHPEVDVVVVVRRAPGTPALAQMAGELREAAKLVERRSREALADRARRAEVTA